MRALAVAGSRAHAAAAVRWLGFRPDDWVLAVYGQRLGPESFGDVVLVRPTEGVTPEILDWVLEELGPRIAGPIETMPNTWVPGCEGRPDPDDPEMHWS